MLKSLPFSCPRHKRALSFTFGDRPHLPPVRQFVSVDSTFWDAHYMYYILSLLKKYYTIMGILYAILSMLAVTNALHERIKFVGRSKKDTSKYSSQVLIKGGGSGLVPSQQPWFSNSMSILADAVSIQLFMNIFLWPTLNLSRPAYVDKIYPFLPIAYCILCGALSDMFRERVLARMLCVQAKIPICFKFLLKLPAYS